MVEKYGGYMKWEQSLNNVHEPRNAEFTAFLGSFLVEGQSNDNNYFEMFG